MSVMAIWWRSSATSGEQMTQTAQTALLVANGRSTRELVEYGFDRLPNELVTVGMNLAHRYYERIDWFPTLYGLCDTKVVENRLEELRGLVTRHPQTTFYVASKTNQLCIHRNLFNRKRLALAKAYPIFERLFRLERFRRIVTCEVLEAPNVLPIKHGMTGSRMTQILIEKGIRRILLIGADADYVEHIKEATYHASDLHLPVAFRRLVITAEVESNPNYFFDDYQRVGDVYSTPRGATSHIDGWGQVAQLAEEAGVEITNCSARSKIPNFDRRPLKECLDELQ